jgi:hypothetical protein
VRSILIAVLLAGQAGAAGPGSIEDDWPRALAEAAAREAPIVVEAWAPW